MKRARAEPIVLFGGSDDEADDGDDAETKQKKKQRVDTPPFELRYRREFLKRWQEATMDQRDAFTYAMSGGHLFITGGAGVGKTRLLELIIMALKHRPGTRISTTAPTGIAATLIGGARSLLCLSSPPP